MSAQAGTRGDEAAWPTAPLARVPSPTGAARLAEQIRRQVLGYDGALEPLLDLSVVCDAAGVTVKAARLAAAHGGTQALLRPQADGRFVVDVDTRPRGGWAQVDEEVRDDLARHRWRFRVAHELAHTLFFWRRGGRPIPSRRPTEPEEHFADAFARELLVPGAAAASASCTPGGVLALQAKYDVSLELAARAVVGAHRDAAGALVWRPAGHRQPIVQWASDPGALVLTRLDGLLDDTCDDEVVPGWAYRWLPRRNQLLLISASAGIGASQLRAP